MFLFCRIPVLVAGDTCVSFLQFWLQETHVLQELERPWISRSMLWLLLAVNLAKKYVFIFLLSLNTVLAEKVPREKTFVQMSIALIAFPPHSFFVL